MSQQMKHTLVSSFQFPVSGDAGAYQPGTSRLPNFFSPCHHHTAQRRRPSWCPVSRRSDRKAVRRCGWPRYQVPSAAAGGAAVRSSWWRCDGDGQVHGSVALGTYPVANGLSVTNSWYPSRFKPSANGSPRVVAGVGYKTLWLEADTCDQQEHQTQGGRSSWLNKLYRRVLAVKTIYNISAHLYRQTLGTVEVWNSRHSDGSMWIWSDVAPQYGHWTMDMLMMLASVIITVPAAIVVWDPALVQWGPWCLKMSCLVIKFCSSALYIIYHIFRKTSIKWAFQSSTSFHIYSM